MAFQFPASPLLGDTFSPAPGLTYEWDGTGWVPITADFMTLGEGDERWVKLDGTSIMTGSLKIEQAIGTWGRFTDESGAANKKKMGFQMNAGIGILGVLNDAESAFTQYLSWDANTGRNHSFAPLGFAVSNAAMNDEFFIVNPTGQLISIEPSTNDSTALVSITGG